MNLKEFKLSFIGGGVMATAFIEGVLKNGLTKPENIYVSARKKETLEKLNQVYKVNYSLSNLEVAKQGEVVVVSVKPQNLKEVFRDLKGVFTENQVILSIVAGAGLSMLENGFSHNKIVRSMPNTPAMIGKGITLWTASTSLREEELELIKKIFQAIGTEIYVDDETYVDMATAVSGTGPSYTFLFIESFTDAAVHLGFPRELAKELVLKTLSGSVALASDSTKHPAELKNMVTSPGGTSAEALYQLEKEGFRTAISKAIWAAYQKTLFLKEKIEPKE